MTDTWQPKEFKDYKWIVKDPELLGGRLAIKGTRISVSLILECLAAGMSLEEINDEYEQNISSEIISEVYRVASQVLSDPDVAA